MAHTILFMPQCHVVAHAGRLLVIAQAVRERFDGSLAFAGDGPYGRLFPKAGFPFHHVPSALAGARGFRHRDQRSALERFYTTMPLSEIVTLVRELPGLAAKAIAGELELYKSLQPDLIVCDNRWTVPISAELAGIPFVSVRDTTVPTFRQAGTGSLLTFPWVAGHAWVRRAVARLPASMQRRMIQGVLRMVSYLSLRLINHVRASFGLRRWKDPADLDRGLRTVLVPEAEVFLPTLPLPPNFHCVGPVVWQPEMEVPASLSGVQDIVYVTMGSTGNSQAFKPLLESLAAGLDCPVVASVGDLVGLEQLHPLPAHVHVHTYLPGLEMAKRARLVICHGALATLSQALSQGVPVIGIPLTLQHEICIDRMTALGVGVKLYAFELTPEHIQGAVQEILTHAEYTRVAKALAPQFSLEMGPQRASDLVLHELKGVQ